MSRTLAGLVALAAAAYLIWTGYLASRFAPEPARLHEDIIVYSRSGCAPCIAMTRLLQAERHPFTEFFVDEDDDASEELRRKLDALGFHQRIYELPVVDIYGTVFPDNPSRKLIEDHLRSIAD